MDEEEWIDAADFLNAPPLAVCGRCQRQTWSPSEVGQEDRMTQPDGFPCGGRFSNPTSAREEAGRE